MRIILCANHPLCESSTGIVRIMCQKTTIVRIILCANHPLRESSCYRLYGLTQFCGLGSSRYQNDSIPDFMGAKGDVGGGNNWSYKTCKAPVKMLPPTNTTPTFYRPDALPVTQPTVSKHWREILHVQNMLYNNNNIVLSLLFSFHSQSHCNINNHASPLHRLQDIPIQRWTWKGHYVMGGTPENSGNIHVTAKLRGALLLQL